ncbi:MAG: VCBS repeat-containing protein [Bacteroidales bacterium]|nr:VCBS repeat-containing protein [Bacteroidales bacterium]
MKHFLLTVLFFMALASPAPCQATFRSPFSVSRSPWVGGLNACQFGRMDLDGDGQKDLLVFDRHGNRLLCFLNKGGVQEIDYQYTNVYNGVFPDFKDWVVFADYDGDGKEDIFTYSQGWAGMKVYRNVSTAEQLDFELVVEPYLTSYQGGGAVNLLATNADYPAIADLDGDGDLDILTFGVMGTFIEKHLNCSMERYGCRDSLVFERTEMCWGRVAESEENNLMYLDTCLFGRGLMLSAEGFRHRGATVAVRDLDGDGLLDLLLADVDYPGLTALYNGGDPSQALMVRQEDFPPQQPVQLHSMPVPYFTDVNNDGFDDLLVSPFDPDPMASVGVESVWLYLNHGTNEYPDFQLYTKSFLQDSMIDVGKGAYPKFMDWDADGLLDLLVADLDGRITFFRNVGTSSQPEFAQMSEALEEDLEWSERCYFDVDQDGLLDLVEGNESGKLTYYHGRGNGFDWVTDFWGGIDVRDYNTSYYGYSIPTLFYYEGQLLLCVGSEQGKLFLYKVSGDPVFEEVDNLWEKICGDMPSTFGMRSAAAVADLNNDGQLEIVVGNFAGGLQLYNAEIAVNNLGLPETQEAINVMIFPNPVQSQIRMVSKEDDILRVMVSDLWGRKILERPVSGREAVLELPELSHGVYLLTLVFDRGLVNRIFFKR